MTLRSILYKNFKSRGFTEPLAPNSNVSSDTTQIHFQGTDEWSQQRKRRKIRRKWRESRNHRTTQGSSTYDNKRGKIESHIKEQPQKRPMVPLTTMHSKFLAPVNQTHAHTPLNKDSSKIPNSRNSSLLAASQHLVTASLQHNNSFLQHSKLHEVPVITLQTNPFSCLCPCSCHPSSQRPFQSVNLPELSHVRHQPCVAT